jgi:hypothetical protein
MAGTLFPRLLGAGCLLALYPAVALASGEGLSSLVRDIGICIMLAGVLAIVFTRLKIPEIAAFLVAGALVGPIGAEMFVAIPAVRTVWCCAHQAVDLVRARR